MTAENNRKFLGGLELKIDIDELRGMWDEADRLGHCEGFTPGQIAERIAQLDRMANPHQSLPSDTTPPPRALTQAELKQIRYAQRMVDDRVENRYLKREGSKRRHR